MAWSIVNYEELLDLSEKSTLSINVDEEEVVCVTVSFEKSGTAEFYTTGDYDTIGFLSTYGVLINSDTGNPKKYVADDDDGGEGYNFRIEYYVEAGEEYFLYYRHYSAGSSGRITLVVVPPESAGYYQPSYDDIEVDVTATESIITIHVTGFDENYRGVWELQYIIAEKDTGEIVSSLVLRSDNDLSFNKVTFDSEYDNIKPGTTYQIVLVLRPYPDESSGVNSWITWEPYEITTGGGGRPSIFKWYDGTTVKKSGQAFDITANEWCDLLDNINAVRQYKGYAAFPTGNYTLTYYYNYFTYPSKGDTFRYQHYNQALNAVTGMVGGGYNSNAVKQGDEITAARINYLVSTLNGIT